MSLRKMIPFLIKRLLISILTLVATLVATFVILHTVPGGPFDQERKLPPEIERNLYEKYGLQPRGDQSFSQWVLKDMKAYTGYLTCGQLGPSLKYEDRDVSQIMGSAMGPSAQLGLAALTLALIVGILAGVIEASRKSPWLDSLSFIVTTLMISIPAFVMAVILIYIFSHRLALFPPALWEGFRYAVLPVVTLAAVPAVTIFRFTKSGVETELKKDYVRTARAKGLTQVTVILKHAFINAAAPILTYMGPLVAYLITGSFIIETIFTIPGLGRHFVTAVVDRDYFLVMGITLLFATVLILLNWMVEAGYRFLDPRMRK